MILVCGKCATRYIVPDSAIGPTGRQVRCASCKHSWYQDGPDLPTRPEAQEPSGDLPQTAETAAGSDTTVMERPEAEQATADVVTTTTSTDSVAAEAAAPDTVAEARPISTADPVVDPYGAPDFAAIVEDEDAEEEAERKRRRPRRNPAKLWTAAAVAFCVAVAGVGGALWAFGPPSWAVNLGLVPDDGEPDLLFYLAKPAERRKLPTGEEYFAFSARIVNSGERSLAVPPVVVELRDRQDRLVFSWKTKADKTQLKPGEEASINESRLDIPKNAANLSLAFVDPTGA